MKICIPQIPATLFTDFVPGFITFGMNIFCTILNICHPTLHCTVILFQYTLIAIGLIYAIGNNDDSISPSAACDGIGGGFYKNLIGFQERYNHGNGSVRLLVSPYIVHPLCEKCICIAKETHGG